MASSYDDVYAMVIQRRWHETPEELRTAAASSNRHGQLAPNSPDEFALLDSLTYQRGHADVFREVYKEAPHVPPTKDQRLLVVDIGAGAATVAIGLREALGRKKRQRIDYLGIDPNPMMRKLGKRLLRRLDAGFRRAGYGKSLEEIDLTGVDRLLFTFSYVSHQKSVTQSDIEQWATLIKGAVDKLGRAVELIYTTAARSGGTLPVLGQLLEQAAIKRRVTPIDVQVQARYPGESSNQGPVQWSCKPWNWKVQAEHWILRA